ncbi:glycoside hydrolase family 88 protein [Nonomuraea sp. 3N208]|uniref:glycoside hydrolase family 88 protein n=1 Tax=Nonomuraea sp. 3N208 TaxID=3457421 RepID=UPI003FD0ABEA
MSKGRGLDTSQASRSQPPRRPADLADLTPEVLAKTAGRIADRAVAMGLTHWFWGEGVVLQGMMRLAGEGSGAPELIRAVHPFVTEFVDGHLRDGIELGHVNNLAPGAVCADLYGATGERRYADACERMLDWLRHDDAVTRAPGGAIEHWPGGVWADTVYMGGTFLIHYGLHAGRPELIEEAGEQILAHAAILQHPETGLYAHGSHEGRTIWNFWGRANAWTALASVEYLEAGGALSQPVREVLGRQLLTLAAHQPAYGIWDVLVDGQPENRGILETSAAAGIAAAMFRAAALGIEPERLRRSAWRALAGVHAYVADDGTLTRTSAGTVLQLLPFGYSVIRDDMIQPWGQGLALQAYAAALRETT